MSQHVALAKPAHSCYFGLYMLQLQRPYMQSQQQRTCFLELILQSHQIPAAHVQRCLNGLQAASTLSQYGPIYITGIAVVTCYQLLNYK